MTPDHNKTEDMVDIAAAAGAAIITIAAIVAVGFWKQIFMWTVFSTIWLHQFAGM